MRCHTTFGQAVLRIAALEGQSAARIPLCDAWARVVSNHRPLACEASALPLSYAPSRRSVGRSRGSRATRSRADGNVVETSPPRRRSLTLPEPTVDAAVAVLCDPAHRTMPLRAMAGPTSTADRRAQRSGRSWRHLAGLRCWSAGSCHIGWGALHRRGLVARVLLVPAGVAGGEGGGAEAVGEDREPHGQVDREHDQVLVGEVRLFDHDHREHDRCQTAGAEPAEEAERRRPGARTPASRSRPAASARP